MVRHLQSIFETTSVPVGRRHASLSRQDSVRSGYVSDRERGYLSDHQVQAPPGSQLGGGHQQGHQVYQRGLESGPALGSHQRMPHQASFESADSKLCYLTSSEVSPSRLLLFPRTSGTLGA